MNEAYERPVGEFVRAYEGVATSLHEARADVSGWLRSRGDDDATVDRAVLIVSELATNAVVATPGSPFSVDLRCVDADHVELTICNPRTDALLPPRSAWVPRDVLAPQGRGLSIVAALSEDVAVCLEPDRVVVTARIRTVTLR